ncbi:MAG: ATP-dependent DNA ligase [bacterium]
MTDQPFAAPVIPMEAAVATELPPPPGWAYEPKWDGFRAVIWSGALTLDSDARAGRGRGGGSEPRLDSRNAKPLLRYFPELEPALAHLPPGTVADGEIVVVVGGRLDFDALQNRIHPAESRVILLARETPAHVALFDLLALRGEDLRQQPFRERRRLLEGLAAELGAGSRRNSETGSAAGEPPIGPETARPGSPWILSPSTTDLETARRWFRDLEAAGFDGIVAKALDRPYAEGRREMVKVKHRRTVDCVIGGYRLHKDGKRVGSLLLGLYDDAGELHFIGHCSSFTEAEAAALLEALLNLAPEAGENVAAGFGEHARHPGAPSRWSGQRESDFAPVRPELVVEVSYDQLTGDRFRHATRFERWRPDKDPRDCTMQQLERPRGLSLFEALLAHTAPKD